MRVLVFYITVVWSVLIQRKIERDINMCIGLYVKCPLFLSNFNEPWIFSTDFRKTVTYKILWKSVQWEPSCSLRKDGQTDEQTGMVKLIVAFTNFSNGLKNVAVNLLTNWTSINFFKNDSKRMNWWKAQDSKIVNLIKQQD